MITGIAEMMLIKYCIYVCMYVFIKLHITICMYVCMLCMYVWSSHLAEYGSTG